MTRRFDNTALNLGYLAYRWASPIVDPIRAARGLAFNRHRIHSPSEILSYFPECELSEFSAVGDDGQFTEDCDPSPFEDTDYSCGLFLLTKSVGQESVGRRLRLLPEALVRSKNQVAISMFFHL